jgi:hypothetical protein
VKVLVTGAEGMLGSTLVPQLARSHDVTAAGSGALDVSPAAWLSLTNLSSSAVRDGRDDLFGRVQILALGACVFGNIKMRQFCGHAWRPGQSNVMLDTHDFHAGLIFGLGLSKSERLLRIDSWKHSDRWTNDPALDGWTKLPDQQRTAPMTMARSKEALMKCQRSERYPHEAFSK